MRIARNYRKLNTNEKDLARQVFRNSLPSWWKIFLTDGLGPLPTFDNPFTEEVKGTYMIHVGPEVYPDAMVNASFGSFGTYKEILVHEMTHVWQYYHGYHVVLRSLWANTVGAGYSYTLGGAWDDYNVEQQAAIVEHWYSPTLGNMSVNDPRYPYIDKIIRPGIDSGFFSTMYENLVIRLKPEDLRRL